MNSFTDNSGVWWIVTERREWMSTTHWILQCWNFLKQKREQLLTANKQTEKDPLQTEPETTLKDDNSKTDKDNHTNQFHNLGTKKKGVQDNVLTFQLIRWPTRIYCTRWTESCKPNEKPTSIEWKSDHFKRIWILSPPNTHNIFPS